MIILQSRVISFPLLGNAYGWLCLPIKPINFAHVVGFGLYKSNFEPVDKNFT